MSNYQIVIPAKTYSNRIYEKNYREFKHGLSLLDIAVEYANSLVHDRHRIRVISNRRYAGIETLVTPIKYPMSDLRSEVDNSLDIWRYGSAKDYPITVLLEPSSYPRDINLLKLALEEFDGRTAVAIQFRHRYGLKAHVFVPSGEFYVATTDSVQSRTCFDGDFRYYQSNAINIDSEHDFKVAQNL